MRLSLPPGWAFRLLGLMLISTLVLISIAPRATAQYSNLDVRLTRIEAENSQLRSRVSQLERSVSRGGPISRAPQTAPEGGGVIGPLSSDPMFDRLATLVIELKERVTTLEAQVTALQRQ